ncbi:MAG: serine--tRNA ligase [Candidatus Nitrosocosmicus sp.]|uniref:serine--tRNA ligase n=1 Tax=Candidatus Nitrosocosmicus sp. FF01 TaxID=3397670 RepID=UPI0039E8B52B
MIDSKIIKENPEMVKEMLIKRNINFPIDGLMDSDKKRRNLIVELQNLKHQKNILAKEIATAKKKNESAASSFNQMEEIGQQIKRVEEEGRENEEIYLNYINSLPNFPHESVPIGKDEAENVVIRKYELDMDGSKFSNNNIFDEPKDVSNFKRKSHTDLVSELDLVDFERAGKISGSRFYILKNELVRLSMALSNFALDYLTRLGYTAIQPPFLIRREAMEGAVILSDFEETIYKVENEDLYLIGTSEHPMASMHMDEIIDGKDLPIKYAGVSSCFRKEAGAHGKDMKGLFRVHQFEKVEQFIFCKPEDSWKEHEKLLQITERFYELLEIPFRTIVLCSGDLGKVSAKTYDIEAWFPVQESYREICSCSNCTDYQARSLKIRFRDNPNDETTLVHTLNSTLVAVQRTIVAILENNQTPRGTIAIPNVLRKYMDNLEEIGGKKIN